MSRWQEALEIADHVRRVAFIRWLRGEWNGREMGGDRSNIHDKDKPTVAESLSSVLMATHRARDVARSRTRRTHPSLPDIAT